ncbi:TPA: hypothetical protein I9786_004470 [Serratia marcescens]|nr:hypothetical protein [Serratia marcescens]HAT5029319.1 hypothetical protein [Serratia marcescens]
MKTQSLSKITKLSCFLAFIVISEGAQAEKVSYNISDPTSGGYINIDMTINHLTSDDFGHSRPERENYCEMGSNRLQCGMAAIVSWPTVGYRPWYESYTPERPRLTVAQGVEYFNGKTFRVTLTEKEFNLNVATGGQPCVKFSFFWGPHVSPKGVSSCEGQIPKPPIPGPGPGPGPSPQPLNCNMSIIGSGFNFGTIPANGMEGKSTTSMANIQCSGKDSDSATGRLTLTGVDGTDKAKIKNSQGDIINIQLIADTSSGSNIKTFYAQNGFNITYVLVARILTANVSNYGEFTGQAIAKLDIY